MPKSGKKAKPGRPAYPPERVRGNRVVTFVTDRELSHLLRLAESEELSMSAVCHQLIGESLQRADRTQDRQASELLLK